MTATTTQPEQTTATSPQTVAVDLDDLIIGRPIQFPIHDDKGVLLLAEGAVINSDFKRLLRNHRVSTVQIDARDVNHLTLGADLGIDSTFSLDNELTKHLDQIIDGGMVPVCNRGPAVKDEMVFLGKSAYDGEQRKRLVEQNRNSTEALSQMMKGALHGGAIDGQAVTSMTNGYMNEMQKDVDSVLSSAIGMFDDESLSAQALQTSLLSMAIGIEMGLDTENVRTLGLAGLVHDWGMMKVPREVRDAPHPLDPMQFHEVKKHPIHSLEMLQNSSGIPRIVSLVAYQVHERPNGTGYPRARSGNAIHQFARIVAVADAYTAMTASREWRAPFMAYAAIECLLRDAQKRNVDSKVVRALLSMLSLFPLGSLVTLNDGSVARVLRRNGQEYMNPIVQVLQTSDGEKCDPLEPNSIVDLAQSELKVEQALPTPGRKELGLTAALEYQDRTAQETPVE